MEGKTAIVFGATGLVGNLLLEELESCNTYSAIRIFVRQSTGISIPGMEEIITDFRDQQSLASQGEPGTSIIESDELQRIAKSQ